MSESKHTPGPWKLNPQPNPNRPLYYSVYVKPGGPETVDHICTVAHQMSENWQANARLIAAAPALLDACKYARDVIGSKVEQTAHSRSSGLALIEAAIALAQEEG